MLGRGGMGVVYRATDLRMPGVQVAIKLLKAEFRARPEMLNMLRESVRKVRSLPHPNIASVYSLDSDGQNDFVIMELLQGQTLQSLLDGEYARGMPMPLARALIADLCAALAYAHDHSVIHSDIKPSNIFVTPSGRAKLFDFDIARVLRGPVGYFDARELGAMTFAYASIEMVEGGKPDPRDDIYALACVIYEMLSGQHPFEGVSALEARERGLSMKPLPALTKLENEALGRALSFERQERLASVEALKEAFAESKTAPRKRAAAPLRRRPWLLPAAAAAVLACAVLAWWLLWQSSGERQALAAQAATEELAGANNLARWARELAVDGADETLRRALALAGSASAARDTERRLKDAQAASTAFLSALEHAPRMARLGTTEAQLQQALELCRLTKQRCQAQDLADEAPRQVRMKPFEIDPTPVTNAEFAQFVAASGRRTEAETAGMVYAPDPSHGVAIVQRGRSWRTLMQEAAGRGEAADALPVLAMDLESARAYCKWKGKRLPQEDEWEYSTRGAAGQVFPWGDAPERPASLPSQPVAVSPSRAPGNVAEWTEARILGQRVVRGGSWLLPQAYFQRLALRRVAQSGAPAPLDASFRCAASATSWPTSPYLEAAGKR
jgi:formylglycine-generating enzyme required for sulfatase activity